jgi:perosamine synthetase
MTTSYSKSLKFLYSNIKIFNQDPYFSYIQGHDYLNKVDLDEALEYLGKNNDSVIEEFEFKFSSVIGYGYSASFASARMGFFCLLKSLDIGQGDEVILNGSTCAVMSNAVIRCGARPIYSDIDIETFGSCPNSIKKLISNKTKMIVAQHSFGIPCKIDEISKIAKDQEIFLLEDCAISLGSKINNIILGNFGDAALFSIDHTKPINTITGGLIYSFNEELLKKILFLRDQSHELSLKKQKAIWNRLVFERKYCNSGNNGKMYLIDFFHRLVGRLFKKDSPFLDEDSVSFKRLNSYPYPSKLPTFLAIIGINEIERWPGVIKERKNLLNKYLEIFSQTKYHNLLPNAYFDKKLDIVPQRLVWLQTDNLDIKQQMEKYLNISQIWFQEPIISTKEPLINFKYKQGDCPIAEKCGKHIMNLPTNMNHQDSKIFLSLIEKIIIN